MRIALCQLDIIWENKEKNLARIEDFISSSAQSGAELLLFPEMTLTGFSMAVDCTAESNGETVELFGILAQKYSIALGFGWVEACVGRARNHYTVVAKTREVLSDYIKIHPFSFAGEDRYFQPGRKLGLFHFGEETIATFICYDLRFPEIFLVASNEASLLVVAANWPVPREEHWRLLLQARAVENQCFVAGVNCVGEKEGLFYVGNTMLVDPQGNIIDELVGREGLIISRIDFAMVRDYRKRFPIKQDRQVNLYRYLLETEGRNNE